MVGCALSSDYDVKKDDTQPGMDGPAPQPSGAPSSSSPPASNQSSAANAPTAGGSGGTPGSTPTTPTCNKATAGPFYPQTAATLPQTAKSTSWGGVGDKLENDTLFTSSFFLVKRSDFLNATHFGAQVPATSKVVGISIALQKYSTIGNTQDQSATLIVKGAAAGAQHASLADWNNTASPASYGGESDAWGLALTGADVNDPDFGFSLSAVTDNNLANAGVKQVAMTVTYCR